MRSPPGAPSPWRQIALPRSGLTCTARAQEQHPAFSRCAPEGELYPRQRGFGTPRVRSSNRAPASGDVCDPGEEKSSDNRVLTGGRGGGSDGISVIWHAVLAELRTRMCRSKRSPASESGWQECSPSSVRPWVPSPAPPFDDFYKNKICSAGMPQTSERACASELSPFPRLDPGKQDESFGQGCRSFGACTDRQDRIRKCRLNTSAQFLSYRLARTRSLSSTAGRTPGRPWRCIPGVPVLPLRSWKQVDHEFEANFSYIW